MAPAPDINDLDLYEVLDLLPNASESEIKKAYRKKALKCHPDKFPDDAKAAKQWELLSKTLEILTDSTARALYDKVLKAKKANELRNKALEAKRRKIKEDLEAREESYKTDKERAQDAARKLENEIMRLREEGSKALAQEQRLMKEQMQMQEEESSNETAKLKVKWKSKKHDATNGGYTREYLMQAFQKYGDVTNIIVSSKRNGSAIAEFFSSKAAEWAVRSEIGRASNPLQLTWLSGEPANTDVRAQPKQTVTSTSAEDDYETMVLKRMQERHRQQISSDAKLDETTPSATDTHTIDSPKSAGESHNQTELPTHNTNTPTSAGAKPDLTDQTSSETSSVARDFETVEMRRMRQAEERRKLIEQMMQEDDES